MLLIRLEAVRPLLILLVLGGLVLAAAAPAAVTPASANACLKAGGAGMYPAARYAVTYSFPEIRSQLWWQTGSRLPIGDGITIMFTRDPGSASKLEARFLRMGVALGWTRSEVLSVLGGSGDVVWIAAKPLTAQQRSLLQHCAR